MFHVYRKLVLTALCVLVLGASEATAQVTFAGDARFRPRLDLDDRTGDPAVGFEQSRFYYLYRMRLNMTAAIGEGYYARSRLSHNGIAFYSRGAAGELPDVFGNPNNTISEPMSARGSVDFMYLYIGRATPTFGFDLGLIPIPGFSNPLWDLHYYPNLMVDVPYFIWNTDGGFGGQAYRDLGPGRLQLYGLLDRALSDTRSDATGVTTREHDNQSTLVASYSVPVGPVRIMPMVMKTFPAQLRDGQNLDLTGEYNAPLTIGGQLTAPRIGPLTPTFYAGYTTSNVAGSIDRPVAAYTGWLARAHLAGKWGPGHVLVWGDIAGRTDEGVAGAPNVDNSFWHAWLNYRIPVFESDRGNFSIGPQWRIINSAREGELMRRRHKIEIDFDVTFR
jgi:hypothetical protein